MTALLGRRRAALTVIVVAALSLFLAAPAWALFSVLSSDATGTSAAAVLGTPVVTTGGVTATSVTFTIEAPANGPTPTAYRVARTAPTTAASVCTVTGSTGSCTDTAPVAGTTNTYAVYAAAGRVVVGVADPAHRHRGRPRPGPERAGDHRQRLADAQRRRLEQVRRDRHPLGHRRLGRRQHLLHDERQHPDHRVDRGTPGRSPCPSTATVRFFSVDKRGNTETPTSLAVKIDTVAPTGALTAPASAAVVSGTVTVSGTAADTGGSGVATVQPQVQQGAGAWTNLGSAITTGASTWSTSWATAGLTDGAYSLRALVTDVAGSTTTTATRSVTVSNTLVVTAPATAVAGTSFNVTIRTAATVSGTKAITVTGLQSSPNGTAPVLKTSASFTSGVATISLTAYRAGSQSITVTTTADGRQGTSGAVVVAPRAQGQLYFTSCSGTTRELPRELGHRDHLRSRAAPPPRSSSPAAPPTTTATAWSTRRSPSPSSRPAGASRSTTITLGAGVTSSATLTFTPPAGTPPARTIEAIGNDDGRRRRQGHADGAALLTLGAPHARARP